MSVSADLKHDARRDLDDVGADYISLHPLNKVPYGSLSSRKSGIEEGVIFLTYSTLISSSEKVSVERVSSQRNTVTDSSKSLVLHLISCIFH